VGVRKKPDNVVERGAMGSVRVVQSRIHDGARKPSVLLLFV
jgi:hypothetical protein